MAQIRFTLDQQFDCPPQDLWRELVDWKAHEKWIPATRVEVGPGDPTAVGATFTAYTGLGRFALEDRMRVLVCDWDESAPSGTCKVEKLGPILKGTAGFTVEARGQATAMTWVEEVTVPYLPQFFAPLLGRIGTLGFRLGLRKLAKLLAAGGARATTTGD